MDEASQEFQCLSEVWDSSEVHLMVISDIPEAILNWILLGFISNFRNYYFVVFSNKL